VRTVRSRPGKSRGFATALRFDGRSRSEGGDEGTRHSRDVRAVLHFVPKQGEAEVFEKVINARVQSSEAREVADRHFFENFLRHGPDDPDT